MLDSSILNSVLIGILAVSERPTKNFVTTFVHSGHFANSLLVNSWFCVVSTSAPATKSIFSFENFFTTKLY